jgi:FMN-dependent NADH-azoreductase
MDWRRKVATPPGQKAQGSPIMATVLYVTCNLKPATVSRSLSVGTAFLLEYGRTHPGDEIQMLDLYRDPIQRIDSDVLAGWGKLRSGQPFAALSEDEQRKISRIDRLADQFVAADKYVFVTPMWNLSFPAELKMYVDCICSVGKTFIYTEKGPKGLLYGKGKKCLHVHSSGGFHSGKPEDFSTPYLKSVLAFLGIEDFVSVVIEGVDAVPHRTEAIRADAIQKVSEIAASL